jgi:O-acetylserine/cysteine efflux transporter
MTERSITGRFVENAPLVVTVLLLFDSLHYVFARLLLPHLAPSTSAMYVIGIGTAEMTIFLAVRGEIRLEVFRRNIRFFLTIGFLVAGAMALSYTGVAFVDPGTASMLSRTSTVFALGFGLLWLRERLAKAELIGVLLALAGVFTIAFQPADYLRLGSLIVLAGAFMYSLHTAVVKRYGGELEFANFFLFRLASVTGFLLLYVVGRGQLEWPGMRAWPILLLTGSVDVVLSRVLYYLALRRLQLSFHTILLTISPAITILWSFILFGSRPTLQGMIGGAVTIAGVAVVTKRRNR